MIYTNIPYCPASVGTNLGYAYNAFMEKLSDDDWAIFLDHDAMFTTPTWYKDIEKIIETDPDNTGMYTCITNRIGNPAQRLSNIDHNNHDMRYHRDIGIRIRDKYSDTLVTYTNMEASLSGVLIVTSKRAWDACGGFMDGFLGVDNDYVRRVDSAGYACKIMYGIYVYHWYRGDGNKDHIPK